MRSGSGRGRDKGRDILTGEVKVEFPPDVDTYWFHHRCSIAKGTDRFLIPSRTGIEFVDTEKRTWDTNHWVRGGCLHGALPCNGLLYAPPHDCACYPETKLSGFNALAPQRAAPPPRCCGTRSRPIAPRRRSITTTRHSWRPSVAGAGAPTS